jgi:hypothetical protein
MGPIILLLSIAVIFRSANRRNLVLSLINLDLITIFSTLFKKKNYLTNIIIVLLFPIAAICRSTRRKEVIIYDLLRFDFIYVLGFGPIILLLSIGKTKEEQ